MDSRNKKMWLVPRMSNLQTALPLRDLSTCYCSEVHGLAELFLWSWLGLLIRLWPAADWVGTATNWGWTLSHTCFKGSWVQDGVVWPPLRHRNCPPHGPSSSDRLGWACSWGWAGFWESEQTCKRPLPPVFENSMVEELYSVGQEAHKGQPRF